MGKRSDYPKKPRDYYPTPLEAVKPLVANLPTEFTYIEPCAGNSDLVNNIGKLTNGICLRQYDIEPQNDFIIEFDALDLTEKETDKSDFIITNPPWTRTKQSGYLMHELLEKFALLKPTWLLLDADWPHTLQSSKYIEQYCVKIVSIGRVKWFGNTTGKDNCCWYLFDSNKTQSTIFIGR